MYLASLVLIIAPALAQDENRPTPDYRVAADLPYCTPANHTPLLMDIFLPTKRATTPTPAILWLHGGGWERGDKNGSSGARLLARNGFVTASIYYRLSGEAKFPADLDDVECALRYLHDNAAKYQIDAARIAIAGASAGAHLALLAATRPQNHLAAVSSYYGPTDFTHLPDDFGPRAIAAITKLIGKSFADNPEAYRRASPLSAIAPGLPPLLILHGNRDQLVPVEQSQRLFQAWRATGAPVEIHIVQNADHDFEPFDKSQPIDPSHDQIDALTVEFFRHYLLK